ncbi:hypothetical protein [Bifidobacterium avesanii]|uniref:Uncharacterized protein n=1 Tax=Bifidobacterium avesanii TaxID=1798157 RepID=A0A7K3TF70_9BIFI|nr:hypothetical protein [Bifidobacterium avesanii]KAB8295657.1 hypothetical protein DSM100685_0267 [Bifidobacterium avesanii]NEG77662.1 hypothetical protein [Bifidobacterium avesanii]
MNAQANANIRTTHASQTPQTSRTSRDRNRSARRAAGIVAASLLALSLAAGFGVQTAARLEVSPASSSTQTTTFDDVVSDGVEITV